MFRIQSLLFFVCCTPLIAAEPTDPRGAVATVHPLATEAGLDALRAGGNAVDAAVAAALMLGVVDGHNSGIGGGCFLLIRTASGEFIAIDGRETAPARATRDMFLRRDRPDFRVKEDGTVPLDLAPLGPLKLQPQPELSLTGPLAVATPGALAAYELALRRCGRLGLSKLFLPAAEVAENGFPIGKAYAARLERMADTLARFPGTHEILLRPDGTPYRAGEILRQADLAATYRQIAEKGIDWFYRGTFAERVGKWMEENGGILSADDFARYRPQLREPLVGTYRGYTIVGFPPPSSGGVHVQQILNVLEHFDLKKLHAERPARLYHVLAEAIELAFADRAHWLGDPDFVRVPRGLVDKQYGAELARRIDLNRSIEVSGHGRPPRAEEDYFGTPGRRRDALGGTTPAAEKHTTHIATADAEGNWVALTATVNTEFGSKVIVPGTGVVLNNEMDDFAADPGASNAFGLVGAEANAVASGKRPLSSMSPTIVLKDGEPILTLGAAGGPTIITQVVQAITWHLDFGLPLPEAVAASRIHHQWRPDELRVEESIPEPIVEELVRMGHNVKRVEPMGRLQAVATLPHGRGFVIVRDPRVER